MRITIERLRTLVLVAGVLLIAALVVFLGVGKWRSRLNLREIPKKLGVDIKQEANGVTYTQSHAGKTLFKIHASKVVQLRGDGRALLHDVQIELYGDDGKRVDRITGNEFEYDQKAGIAKATGPVEITIMRPGVAPAIAPNAAADKALDKGRSSRPGSLALGSVAQAAASGEIDVKTSGLVFDQKSGKATTAERVEFSTLQASGSSLGAVFDSGQGQLVLERAVELNVKRVDGDVAIRAGHAEFERADLVCRLQGAMANYAHGQASAGDARVLFREDGSAERMDVRNGFALSTQTGGRIGAPTGTLEFNERNRPKHGHLDGGVTMESIGDDRRMNGSAPSAELTFGPDGQMRHAHLERGVAMHTEQAVRTEGNQPELRERRDWHSAVADVDFRAEEEGKLEIASMRGTGGVVVTGETQRGNGLTTASRMAADTVSGQFGEKQQLTTIVGEGHASLEQTTAAGAYQTTAGDRVEVHFGQHKQTFKAKDGEAGQIESATIDGNVVMTQTPTKKPGADTEAGLRATAGRAVYEGAGEWLHLTVKPRVEDGGLQLTADKVDLSQGTGDAFARGNVKATWSNEIKESRKGQGTLALGGQGPAHIVAAEAQLHEATGEATFRGKVRLWQDANSIAAPVVVLNRSRQTLVAHGAGTADPVKIALLNGNPNGRTLLAKQTKAGEGGGASTVIRIKSGEMKYSEAERKILLTAGSLGRVTADTGTATTTSTDVELVMLPPGNHAAPDGGAAQVDRLIARGNVVVSSQGRSGTGQQLVYSSQTGEYVLTGTSDAPPRLTDPGRGTVTGESLIFNTRDDSVSIEGQGQRTSTQTTSPK